MAATGQPVSVVKSAQRNSAFVKKAPSGEWQTLIRATSQLQSHRQGTKAAAKCVYQTVTRSTQSCCSSYVCITALLHACLHHCAAACMFASLCCCMHVASLRCCMHVCITALLHAWLRHCAAACMLHHCAAACMFCSSLSKQHQLVVDLSACGVCQVFCFIACHLRTSS